MFNVGDLCECTFGQREYGVLYRITGVGVDMYNKPCVDIEAVYSFISDWRCNKKYKQVEAKDCKLVTLVDLGTQHMKLVQVIVEHVQERST